MHQQEIELVWEKLFANVSAVIDIKRVLGKKKLTLNYICY